MPPRHVAPDVLSWASIYEPELHTRAARLAALPFVDGHVALMPDAHIGMGSDIGTVFATQGAIIPSAIGVDIGCGMIAVRTTARAEHLPDDLAPLHSMIAKAIPAGVGRGHGHATPFPLGDPPATPLGPKDQRRKVDQFATLGSGNHFVEVCLDEQDQVWVVLHSGSRGIGNLLAQRHIERAKGLMRDHLVDLPDPDLAYLVDDHPAFAAYIGDMLWAQDYAFRSRERMMDAALAALGSQLPDGASPTDVEVERINCHHNYTARENHAGRDVWLTRKGAVSARAGQLGVIPGSMATATYIVEGLGSPDSYQSCAHGAGRRLSRGRARRELDPAALVDAMAGKAWNGNALALLDEAPQAYKDIDRVMADQADLVRPVVRLTQVLNYKGEDGYRRRR